MQDESDEGPPNADGVPAHAVVDMTCLRPIMDGRRHVPDAPSISDMEDLDVDLDRRRSRLFPEVRERDRWNDAQDFRTLSAASPGNGTMPVPESRALRPFTGIVPVALVGCLMLLQSCMPSASGTDCRRWDGPGYFATSSTEDVERCLSVFAPGQRDRFGRTALHRAAADAPVATVRLLLAGGWDIEARDMDGGTPLHDASNEDGNHPVLRHLLKTGADPNARDVLGRTPLHLAAAGHAHPASILMLLEAGADPGARDRDGWTPVRYAREFNGSDSVLRTLKDAGDRAPEP